MATSLERPVVSALGAPFAPPAGELKRALSLFAVIALVSVNMMGTSIYTLPASLAQAVGPLGLAAWILTAVGYYFVAVVYARLGSRYPRSGGAYVYTREAFGDFAGFLVAWSYWVSAVVGNAAIVTSVVGYVGGLYAPLASSPWSQFAVAQVCLWGLCWLNVRGVRQSAIVQMVIMVVTGVPLVLIGLGSLGAFEASNLKPFAPHGIGSLATAMTLVVWAYSGVESATVPAEEVQAPESTIRKGTLWGYALGTGVYLLVAIAAIGAVPTSELSQSARPLALVAERAMGPWAGFVMSWAGVIGGLGTLNGWTLLAGRIPLGASQDGLFPPLLAKIHPVHGTPARALVIGTAIASVMCVLYFSESLLGVFNFVVLLAVFTTLLPHLFSAGAELMLVRRGAYGAPGGAAQWVAVAAFSYLFFSVYGAGGSVVMWGVLVVLAGLPIYVMLRTRAAD